VIVILSDGWERGDPALVGREMARLRRLAHRSCGSIPACGARLRPPRGRMAAALPHCDALVSGHSLDALAEVVAAIAGHQVGTGAASAPAGPPPAPALRRGRRRAVAERDPGSRQLGGDAQRLRPEPGTHDTGMESALTDPPVKRCIFPAASGPPWRPTCSAGPSPASVTARSTTPLRAPGAPAPGRRGRRRARRHRSRGGGVTDPETDSEAIREEP